jgi:branched-chain amino acid transport system substrate-binding protein
MTRSSRRRIGAILLAALAVVGVPACGHQTQRGGPNDRIKVGLLVSLSGTYQSVGTDMRDGFRLYLSSHGDRLGGHPVQLTIADEGDGPATALPAATKMIKQDRVDVLAGIVGGGSVAAIAPLAAQAHIPLVGANGRPDLKDVSWVWHTSFLSDEPGAAIAGYVHDTVHGPVYAIGPDYQGGWDELRGFTDAYAKAGGQLANPDGKATFTPFPQTSNFGPYLAKMKASGAKAVYCFYAGKAAIDFVTQYAQSDVKDVPLYAAGFLTEGAVLPAQGGAAAGIQTVLNYSPDLDNAANRTFVSAWQADKVKHAGPPTTYAMASWDAAALLDKAIAAAGNQPTPTAINAAIGRLGQIDSPRGAWQFSPKTHSPVQKWYLRRVQADGSALANVVVSDLATLGSTG